MGVFHNTDLSSIEESVVAVAVAVDSLFLSVGNKIINPPSHSHPILLQVKFCMQMAEFCNTKPSSVQESVTAVAIAVDH